MITKFDVRNSQGGLLTLTLEDDSSGIYVADIQGLDPGKATFSSSSFASLPGAQYLSSRRETRNITLELDLEPDYVTYNDVGDIRNMLYGFFMPQTQISLRFYRSDGLTVDISAWVESFEDPFFTAAPKVNISLLCFDPDFLGIADVSLAGSTVSTTVETPVVYSGTIDTGMVFTLNVNRALTSFTIYHRGPDNVVQSMDFAASLVAGDVIKISTVSRSKYVTLTRAGATSSLVYAVPVQSSWPKFKKGTNNIRVYALGAAIPYTISYTPRYGGL